VTTATAEANRGVQAALVHGSGFRCMIEVMPPIWNRHR
jgi:hypothetical protein